MKNRQKVFDKISPKAVLSELVVAAAKAECELVVPDAEDITFLEEDRNKTLMQAKEDHTSLNTLVCMEIS